MAIIKRKGKNKVYYVAEVYVKGLRLLSKTFDTKTAACVWHDKEKRRLKKGVSFIEEELDQIKLQDCVEKYFKEHVSTLRPSSQRKIIEVVEKAVLKSPLAKVSMADIKAYHIDQWIDWALKTFFHENRESLSYEFKRLVSVLNWWRNYVDPNFIVPVVKKHRNRCFLKTSNVLHKTKARPDYFIRPADVRSWLERLSKIENPAYYRLAQFMILTGARVSEACAMMWSEVDLEEKSARVVRTVDWKAASEKEIAEHTKTKTSQRLLLLPEKLVELLRVMKKEKPQKKLVFTNRKGGALRYTSIRWAFDKAFKDCDLPWRGTHICRHTYATMALVATNSISAVQASLGHKDQEMTQRYAKAVALLNSDMAERTAHMYEAPSMPLISKRPQIFLESRKKILAVEKVSEKNHEKNHEK